MAKKDIYILTLKGADSGVPTSWICRAEPGVEHVGSLRTMVMAKLHVAWPNVLEFRSSQDEGAVLAVDQDLISAAFPDGSIRCQLIYVLDP